MRKLLIHISVACFFLGLFLLASDALAQTTPPPTGGAPLPTTPATPSIPKEAGWFGKIYVALLMGILSLMGWILGMAGILLNFSISYLVIGMGDLVLKGGFGVPIDAMWKLVRDLVNLCFVFALLYMGIYTILEGSTAKIKSGIAGVIVSALLVNFSLYFTKAIIDVSNVTAYHIFTQMTGSSAVSPINDYTRGVSAVFAQRLGVIPLVVGNQNSSIQQRILIHSLSVDYGWVFLLIYTIGGAILIFKLAILFLLGAFILVIRFVTLILLMIFSPVAFLPKILPKLGTYTEKWWNVLLTQAFVAPVYLFGLYLTLQVLTHAPWNRTGDGLLRLFDPQNNDSFSSMSILLFYVIGIIMLGATTMMAKSMSKSGAQVGTHIGKAAGAALAAGAFAGRNSGGRLGKILSKREWLLDGASKSGITGFASRRLLNMSKAAASATWDARNMKGFREATKDVGADVGEGSKLTFNKRLEEIEKYESKYAKDLGERKKTPEEMAEIEAMKSDIKKRKDDLKSLESQANSPDPAVRAAKLEERKVKAKELEEKEDELALKKNKRAMQYANTVQGGFMGTGLFPYTKGQSKLAADKIRENIKKEKKDTDKLIDAIKDSAKKD